MRIFDRTRIREVLWLLFALFIAVVGIAIPMVDVRPFLIMPKAEVYEPLPTTQTNQAPVQTYEVQTRGASTVTATFGDYSYSDDGKDDLRRRLRPGFQGR